MITPVYESFVNDIIKNFKKSAIDCKDVSDEEFVKECMQKTANEIVSEFKKFSNTKKQKDVIKYLTSLCYGFINNAKKDTKYDGIEPVIECADVRGILYGELIISKNNTNIYKGAKTKGVGNLMGTQDACFTRLLIKNHDKYGTLFIDKDIPEGLIYNHVENVIIPIYGELANVMVVCDKSNKTVQWFIANKLANTLENMHSGKQVQMLKVVDRSK